MKVLVCVYSCLGDPDKRFGNGGESFLGWNMVRQISRFNKVWALTHYQNRKPIEKKMAQELLMNVNFSYIRLPSWIEVLNKFHGGIQIYAYLWQIKAYFVAKKLHKKVHFDLFHHVTYANDWMASFIGAFLPTLYIRGSGGGAHKVPKEFLKEYSLKEKLVEKLRSIGQWLFRHDPFFIIGQDRAEFILVCNKESFNALSKIWQKKACLFPVGGILKKDLDSMLPKKTSNNKFSVISAGKLIKIKGFDLTIKAFKIFNDRVTESELIIVGSGPQFPFLNNLVKKLHLEKKVKFEKWIPREELLKKLIAADVFLFSSLRDGGAGIVIEAMASSKPVICFDISGPGFHIDERCGIKIKPDNPKQAVRDMAIALEKLYFDKELGLKLGKAAREKVEREYLWEELGKRLHKIYQKTLHGK